MNHAECLHITSTYHTCWRSMQCTQTKSWCLNTRQSQSFSFVYPSCSHLTSSEYRNKKWHGSGLAERSLESRASHVLSCATVISLAPRDNKASKSATRCEHAVPHCRFILSYMLGRGHGALELEDKAYSHSINLHR